MHHYLDIRLLPDPEFPSHQLLAALYSKLHRALAQNRSHTIGVTFPGYAGGPLNPGLGTVMRLLGPKPDLFCLMEAGWLQGMRDHVQVTDVATVPAGVTFRSLRRVQAKSSAERLRRRQIRRHGLTDSQARERVPDSATERLDLPFLALSSASTGQKFRLYLELGAATSVQEKGVFNAYGLSKIATVPWF